MTKKKLVVIGNGMAPGRALEKLLDAARQLRPHHAIAAAVGREDV